MPRVLTSLSMLLLQWKEKGSETKYVLQMNRHLNGYNFFGGHIDEGEGPMDAALRELQEEISQEELQERWNISIDDNIPEEEPAREEEGGMSRLMAAKLRARQKQDERE